MIQLKNKLLLAVTILVLATASCSFTNNDTTPIDPEDEGFLIKLVYDVLELKHYAPAELDDDFSQQAFDNFIENLDPAKRYFTAADYKEFKKYRKKLDDQIESRKVELFDLAYNRLEKRRAESYEVFKEVIADGFNFDLNEEIETDYDKIAFAKNNQELKTHWRKMLKFSALSNFTDLQDEQEAAIENDPNYETKTDEQLKEEAIESVKRSWEENFDFGKDIEREDYFSAYVNAVASVFDPHTAYLAPRNKERFDQSMRGSLEGIGARLQKNMDNIKIVEIISGGPAWKSEEVEVGDKILKVAQENDSIPTSIVGMRISDAVELIKGPKGTHVKLTLKKVDGSIKPVTLTRDVVELEDTFAKSTLIETDDDKLYGMIHLPKFYFDMSDKNGRAAGDDIKKELERLKQAGAQGLVLDLRNNGGGSLREVIEMAGLFIKEGPVVQVKDKEGRQQTFKDPDASVTWDKPMVILVNELSASASEILAAAMQDYERAIIVGSEQTFGKGTVQYLEPLNRWVSNSKKDDLGHVKLTSQKFYRVNGGSTQLKGVESDVVLPDRYSYINIGERDEQNPLPYDQIKPARINKFDNYLNYDEAVRKSRKRVASSEEFRLIDEHARWLSKQRKESIVPLNSTAYRSELDQVEQTTEKYDTLNNFKNDLKFDNLSYDENRMDTDSTLREKRKRWHKNLTKDIYLGEAIQILNDLKIKGQVASKNDGLGY